MVCVLFVLFDTIQICNFDCGAFLECIDFVDTGHSCSGDLTVLGVLHSLQGDGMSSLVFTDLCFTQ